MKTDRTIEYWALYYHIYVFIKNTGDYAMAMEMFKQPLVVQYFINYHRNEIKEKI